MKPEEEQKMQLAPQELFDAMTPEQMQMSRPFFEAVKRGDVDKVRDIASRVDISRLYTDDKSFHQNALYPACQIKIEELALRMV